MTILEYYEGLYAAKQRVKNEEPAVKRTVSRFDYGMYVAVSRKKKGNGKGYKVRYEWQWHDRKSYCEALRANNPTEYGLLMCRIEFDVMTNDNWWNTPNYRKTALKEYRARIAAIRKEYGLDYELVKQFYAVM